MPDARPSRHLWEIDLIRLLTFTAVISVHSLAFTQKPANEVAAGFMMLLQFGREVFFAITGFVLVYSSIGRLVKPLSFWRRRIPFVAVPYLVWTTIYYAVRIHTGAGNGIWSWSTFGNDVLYGAASYHLYFLVVTIQLYLVFPFLVRFVRATATYALPVLVVVGLANLTWFGFLQYGHAPAGAGWFWRHGYELLPTYAVYVLGGAYGAMHLDRIQAALAAHRARVAAVAAVGVTVALSVYAVQLGWMRPRVANAVTQPAMFASCVAAVAVLGLVGQRWVAAGMPGRRAVTIGSEISFGVYLAHPLVLTVLTDHGLGNGHQVVPSPIATVLAIFGAIAGASILSLVARRTPLALFLIGRPWVRAVPPAPAGSGPASPPPEAVLAPPVPVPGPTQPILTEVSAGGNRRLMSQG
jgi:peptidoglycan/LPS O-acetylase OafA/YrhL